MPRPGHPVDDDLPVPRRRLGGLRQGLHQVHPREGALRRPQRHARPRVRRHHCAHPRASGVRGLGSELPTSPTRHRLPEGAARTGRFLVRPLGGQLHLRHLASAPGHAGHELEHERAVVETRRRLAAQRPTARRRLGRTLQHLRRSHLQGHRARHRFPDRLGYHGPLRHGRPHRPRHSPRGRLAHPQPQRGWFVDRG